VLIISVPTFYFFDTCSLLNLVQSGGSEALLKVTETQDQDRSNTPPFFLSITTLRELEQIKTSRNKTDLTRSSAHQLSRWLYEDNGKHYRVSNVYHNPDDPPDQQIIDDCKGTIEGAAGEDTAGNVNITFVTDDICCAVLARAAGITTISSDAIVPAAPPYLGYTTAVLNDNNLATFYTNLSTDPSSLAQQYNLRAQQYLLIDHVQQDGTITHAVDSYVYRDSKLCKFDQSKGVASLMLGKIKPKDIYQQCAIDSILNNTLTLISGRAGSGKSLIALATIMQLIEKGRYSKLVIMFNPVKVYGASDLGFYPGSLQEKALSNSIGNVLTTKFGDRLAIERLIDSNKLTLVSMADIRGMEIRDDEILYITEAQNMSVDLMKLCLSRASSGCKIIIEGDFDTQVDSPVFKGAASGMKRAIEKLCGNPEVGYVHLPNIWRSKIAQLVERL